MTELEQARQEVDAAMKGQRTWAEGESPERLRANLERLVREEIADSLEIAANLAKEGAEGYLRWLAQSIRENARKLLEPK